MAEATSRPKGDKVLDSSVGKKGEVMLYVSMLNAEYRVSISRVQNIPAQEGDFWREPRGVDNGLQLGHEKRCPKADQPRANDGWGVSLPHLVAPS